MPVNPSFASSGNGGAGNFANSFVVPRASPIARPRSAPHRLTRTLTSQDARWQTRPVKPRLWAGLAPFGIGRAKPHHYLEMARAVWDNRHAPLYAWRILSRGVCDGCALGVSGFRDWTIEGIHLCTTRLSLLSLNTMRAMDPDALADVAALRKRSSAELRA